MFLFSLISIFLKNEQTNTYTINHHTFNTTFSPELPNVFLKSCSFFNLRSQKQGAAIFIENKNYVLSCILSSFNNCTSPQKGGALFSVAYNNTIKQNCFAFCASGIGNSCDASAVFSQCSNTTLHQYNSYDKCPPHNQKCWYGICIFWFNNLYSSDINSSSSHTSFATGLMHCQTKGSIYRYTSFNASEGNTISFVNGYWGITKYGIIIENNVKTGLVYCQAAEHNISCFIFKGNSGPLTYMCISGKCNFYDCLFDSKVDSKGNGFGQFIDCKTEQHNINLSTYKWDISFDCAEVGNVEINNKEEKQLLFSSKIVIPQVFFLVSILIIGYFAARFVIYRFKRRKYRKSLSFTNKLNVDEMTSDFF